MIVTMCDKCKKPYKKPFPGQQYVLPKYQIYLSMYPDPIEIDLCLDCQEEFEKRFENWLNDSEED